MPTVFNAANEMAVRAFLKGNIRYLEIYEMIEKAMEELKNSVSSPKYAKAVEEEILKAKALQGEIYSNAARNMKKEQ